MVYTERAEMAAVSCGISHASAVSTPLRWILKNKYKKTRYKKLFTHVESHASAVSLLESGEQLYIKAINNNNNNKKSEPMSNKSAFNTVRFDRNCFRC